jgi:hydroxymethylpyrimidine pyrophosphatase-like HAD family hydrolase
MAAFFFDIDGTLLNYHTQEWVPGAKELLSSLREQGDTVILITARDTHDAGKPWSIEETERVMKEAGFSFQIIYGVPWDRHIIDDYRCYAHNRVRDKSYYEHNPLSGYVSLKRD